MDAKPPSSPATSKGGRWSSTLRKQNALQKSDSAAEHADALAQLAQLQAQLQAAEARRSAGEAAFAVQQEQLDASLARLKPLEAECADVRSQLADREAEVMVLLEANLDQQVREGSMRAIAKNAGHDDVESIAGTPAAIVATQAMRNVLQLIMSTKGAAGPGVGSAVVQKAEVRALEETAAEGNFRAVEAEKRLQAERDAWAAVDRSTASTLKHVSALKVLREQELEELKVELAESRQLNRELSDGMGDADGHLAEAQSQLRRNHRDVAVLQSHLLLVKRAMQKERGSLPVSSEKLEELFQAFDKMSVAGKRLEEANDVPGVENPEDELDVGDATGFVHQGRSVMATVMYRGEITGRSGLWLGIMFSEPIGKNDGRFQGRRYFSCPKEHGLFLQQDAVEQRQKQLMAIMESYSKSDV